MSSSSRIRLALGAGGDALVGSDAMGVPSVEADEWGDASKGSGLAAVFEMPDVFVIDGVLD
jgi:hypothetical protein